ncbi:MAG: hypothetical protein H0W64_06830 [Gammaproteobacteria bacterium]|nr:hypothetical protein [Gammaproteobacteria bacterium]
MYRLLGLGCIILLSSCATTTNNSNSTPARMDGTPIQAMTARYGQPLTVINHRNGHSIYTYRTVTYKTNVGRNPPVAVANTGNKPVIVTRNPIEGPANQGNLALTCTLTFETDARGIVIAKQATGNGCR